MGRKLVYLFFLSFLLVGSLLSFVPSVKAQSTFGNTNIETTPEGVGYVRAYSFTLSEDGTVTVIDAYCDTGVGSGNARVAIYSDVASHPSALLVESGSEAVSSTDWQTFDVADTFLSAGIYWLAFQSDSDLRMRSGIDAGRGYEYDAHVYGAFPDPMVPSEENGKVGSIYATYSVGGQDLTFPLFENFKVLSSISKSIELHNPLFENFNTWSSLSTSKEQSLSFFEAINIWSSLSHTTEGVAQDLTFLLFETVFPFASMSSTVGEAYVLEDALALAAIAFVLAIVAICLLFALKK